MRKPKGPSPAMVVACLSLFVALSGVTYAATGGNFILGVPNTATSETALTASGATTMNGLKLTNSNTASGATALNLNVPAGHTPLKVNSGAKVANLNADKLDGLDSTAFLRTTGKASDSELLDGLDSTAFLPVGGKSADANLLDGLDSSLFVRGPGQIFKGARALAPDSSFFWPVLVTANPAYTVGYNCPTNLASNGVVVFRNDSGETINVFSDNGGSNPLYQSLGPGGRWDQFAAPGGERYTFQIQGSTITTIELNSVHRASDCHIQGEAVVAR